MWPRDLSLSSLLSPHTHPRGSTFAVSSAWNTPSSYHKPSLFLPFGAQLECHLFLEALSGCHLLLGALLTG